jgi:hypothetical protein
MSFIDEGSNFNYLLLGKWVQRRRGVRCSAAGDVSIKRVWRAAQNKSKALRARGFNPNGIIGLDSGN